MAPARIDAIDGVRLDFRLSPFCRIAWVSEAARSLWEPRLNRVRAASEDLAVLAARDANAGRVIAVRPTSLDRLKQLASAHAVAFAILEPPPFPSAHATARGTAGRTLLRLGAPLAADPDGLARCNAACASGHAIGTSSGDGDPVWEAAMRTPGAVRSDDGQEISAWPNWGANPLLAGIGITAARSWPCSFACSTAQAEAVRVVALGRAEGRGEEVAWLEELLSWPMIWSALHGIAEIKTPVFRYVRDTIATGKRLTVKCTGGTLPDAAARGLGFPFRPKRRAAARAGIADASDRSIA